MINYIKRWLRKFLDLDNTNNINLKNGGISYLANKYNDPTYPREDGYQTPKTVYVIYNNQIKRAVLQRVPKHISGENAVGLVGIINPTIQTFIPLYRIANTEIEAQSILDMLNRI